MAVPVDFSMTVCVSVTLTGTFPKTKPAGVRLSVGVGTLNWIGKVSVTVPALAVNTAVCGVETGDTFSMNWALVAFACTSTPVCVVRAALLLDKPTLKPPANAGPLSVTMQGSVPVPTIEALLQERPVSCGSPVPLRANVAAMSAEELLVIVN
jgi:hypothetical protein